MDGIIRFTTANGKWCVPLAIYGVGLLITFIAAHSFKTFFWRDALRIGRDMCFIGFTLLIRAGFDGHSTFAERYSSQNLVFPATIIYFVVFLACFLGATRSYQYVEVNRLPLTGIWSKELWLWLGAFVLTNGLGVLCISLSYDLP